MKLLVPGKTQQGERKRPLASFHPCLQGLRRPLPLLCSTMSAGPQKASPMFHHACRASEGPPCLQGLRIPPTSAPPCLQGLRRAPSICRIESPAPPCSEVNALVAGISGREPDSLTGWLLPPSSTSQGFARGRRNVAGKFCVGCSLWSAHMSSVSFSRAWLR